MMSQTTNMDTLQSDDFQLAKRPPLLNVLTILTIIGCCIFLIFTLATPGIIGWTEDMMAKANTSEMSPAQIKKMEEGKAKMAITKEHMVPVMAVNIVGLALCLFGAIMMRKLKKDGYWLYLAGQLIPLIGGIFIMGFAMYNEPSSIGMIAITVIFIILYTTQRKYLVR